MSDKKSIGSRLKTLRVECKSDQKEMARRMSMSVSTWSALETGRIGITEERIRLLREKFDINPLWLLMGEGQMLVSADSPSVEADENEHFLASKQSIAKRVRQLRESLGLTQEAFYRPWSDKKGTYSSTETGRNWITPELLLILTEQYKANPTWMLTGVGPMLLDTQGKPESTAAAPPRKDAGIITVTVDNSGNENIVQVGNKARGGYPARHLEPEYLQELPSFSLPGTRYRNGTFRAFEVAGDSMQTTCYPGDVIIAQKLYNWATEIREGYVHIIVTHDDILVKRVLNRLIDSGNLVLKSDNFAYPTQLLDGEEVLEVWVAKAKLSPQFINNRYDGAREQFQTQADLTQLAQELADFKKAVADKLGMPARELGQKKSTLKK